MKEDDIEEGFLGFVSHSTKDFERVRLVRNALEDSGFRPILFYLKCLENETEVNDLSYVFYIFSGFEIITDLILALEVRCYNTGTKFGSKDLNLRITAEILEHEESYDTCENHESDYEERDDILLHVAEESLHRKAHIKAQ